MPITLFYEIHKIFNNFSQTYHKRLIDLQLEGTEKQRFP